MGTSSSKLSTTDGANGASAMPSVANANTAANNGGTANNGAANTSKQNDGNAASMSASSNGSKSTAVPPTASNTVPRGVVVPFNDMPRTKRMYDAQQPRVLPQYFLGRNCLERAQENFHYQRDLAKFNRKCDTAPCATACTHQFSPCRRGCDASFLHNADIFSHAPPSTCLRTSYDRESALLARQLAAYRSGDQRARCGMLCSQQQTCGADGAAAYCPLAAQQVAAQRVAPVMPNAAQSARMNGAAQATPAATLNNGSMGNDTADQQ